MKLLVYIPAFNEEETIKEAIKAVPKNIDGVDSFNILVVDDGSIDNTANLAKEAGAIVISHGVNKKVGMAFRTALNYARDNKYDILVSIDADRQFDANQIPDIIKPILRNEADMVLGNRFSKGMPENMSKSKYWGNKLMSKLISFITKQTFRDVSCGFRAYGKEALFRLNLYGKFTYTQETILDMAYKKIKIKEMPISIKYFKNRKSRVAKSLLNYAWKTSSIIFSFLTIYKPMTVLLSYFSLVLVLNLILLFFASSKAFDIVLIISIIGLGLLFSLLLFKNIRRIINNQDRILTKLEKKRYEERH